MLSLMGFLVPDKSAQYSILSCKKYFPKFFQVYSDKSETPLIISVFWFAPALINNCLN